MAVQLSPIDAHERSIGQVFSDTYAFEVPPYQRPYAWEVEQARELLEDLLDAMDNEDPSGSAYFLGSIVLIKSPNNPHAQVVDGQQRLTTLTILLSILRDLTTDQKVKLPVAATCSKRQMRTAGHRTAADCSCAARIARFF